MSHIVTHAQSLPSFAMHAKASIVNHHLCHHFGPDSAHLPAHKTLIMFGPSAHNTPWQNIHVDLSHNYQHHALIEAAQLWNHRMPRIQTIEGSNRSAHVNPAWWLAPPCLLCPCIQNPWQPSPWPRITLNLPLAKHKLQKPNNIRSVASTLCRFL